MRADLLPTFIRFIDRVKECHRVSHVDHHWKAQLTSNFPNGTQARVIHFDQLSLIVFDMQPKRFPDLQPLRACIFLDLEPAPAQPGIDITPEPTPIPLFKIGDTIAIRTGIIKDQMLYVQAAAGVVADSVPELEWRETEAKARALLRAAELVEEGLE